MTPTQKAVIDQIAASGRSLYIATAPASRIAYGLVEKIGESAQTWLNAGAVGMVDDVHRGLMGPLSSAGPSTSGWGNKSNVRGSPWIRLVPTQCHPGPSWHVRAGQYGLA